MKLFTLYNTAGSVNTYLIGHENGGDAIIIDPGQIDLHILDILETNNYYIKNHFIASFLFLSSNHKVIQNL